MNQETDSKEQHQIWIENSGYLYDRLVVHKLKWPSLTMQWLPFCDQTSNETVYRCLYATTTSGNEPQEHIYVAEIGLPHLKSISSDIAESQPSRVKRLSQFTLETQVNKVRCFEGDASFIAARCDNAPIYIFKMNSEFPIHVLGEVQEQTGFALDWLKYGLATGNSAGSITVWRDIEQDPQVMTCPTKVGDTKWHSNDILVSVGDDGFLRLWDLRMQRQAASSDKQQEGNAREIYCVAVNRQNRNLMITGGEDPSIKLWDIRQMDMKLHKFEHHDGPVVSLDWSHTNPTVFASGSLDKKVKIWDHLRVGFEVPKDLGGTDELLFTHQGHRGAINQVAWNPYAPLLASVEQDENFMQIYEMTNFIHELGYGEDMEYMRSQFNA